MAIVNNAKQLRLPDEVAKNIPLKKAFDDRDYILFQLYQATIGTTSTVTGDLTADPNSTVVCNNTALITVTLPVKPSNDDIIIIKRMNTGDVSITSTVNIDGLTTQTLSTIYDSMTVKYISDLAVWIII